MKHDEKEFLALLQRYTSEETKKARRNLSVASFIIICAWVLGLRLNEVRVLGADISRAQESVVLIIGAVLLSYWLALFIVSWLADREIQKERMLQGNEAANAFETRYTAIKAQMDKRSSNPNYSPPMDWGEVKNSFNAYTRQKERTTRAAKYSAALHTVEIVIPLLLTGAALSICGVGIWNAL